MCGQCGRLMECSPCLVGIAWVCFECPDYWIGAFAGQWPQVVYARLDAWDARDQMRKERDE